MRAETESRQARVDRNEVLSLSWNFVCLVFRGDPVWYRIICRDYRDIIFRIVRYHQIRHIGISYPYPECWGLTSRYRTGRNISRYETQTSSKRKSKLQRCCSETVGRWLSTYYRIVYFYRFVGVCVHGFKLIVRKADYQQVFSLEH